MNKMQNTLLTIRDLCLGFGDENASRNASYRPILQNVDLHLFPHTITALIGQSGSGKTLLARAIIDLLPPGCQISKGDIFWNGVSALQPGNYRKNLRGTEIATIFQEPLSALNPAIKIGTQLTEAVIFHERTSLELAQIRALDLLLQLSIHNAKAVMQQYPHQLSGGMRQRIMIAAAIMSRPKLIIADEPTTALDPHIGNETMALLVKMARIHHCAILVISHDIANMLAYADNFYMIENGKIIAEQDTGQRITTHGHAPLENLLRHCSVTPENIKSLSPKTPLKTSPKTWHDKGKAANNQHKKQPLLRVNHAHIIFSHPGTGKDVHAVQDISLSINAGETMALIGKSGSGKTSLARAICGLQPLTSGEISFFWPEKSETHNEHIRHRPVKSKSRPGAIQYIFQDSSSALDPQMRIIDAVCESLHVLPHLSKSEKLAKAKQAMTDVELDPDIYAHRFPHQLSGGQRQRACIARAIAPDPDFIIADEPVAALDAPIQKQIMLLFEKLQQKTGFALLLVTHDLIAAALVADIMAVLKNGQLLAYDTAQSLLSDASIPYVQSLLKASHCLYRQDNHYQLCNFLQLTQNIAK